MKRERLHLSPHQSIETSRDFNGRFWIAYSSGASMFFRDVKELRRFLKLPAGIPSRTSFDSWIASLDDADNQRSGAECHQLDESDPNHNTRTII